MTEEKVIIVGGGFAGISAALELEKKHIPNIKIILVSDKPHFEFHASLYRVLAGHSPLEVCIPLREIFKGKNIEVVEDLITKIDVEKKELKGASDSVFHYDYLVLALGSQINYYGIDGLEKYSFNINSITQALRLKRHLHEIFAKCQVLSKDEKECSAHIVVVGAGATGCEVAGELAVYSKKLAHQHNLDPAIVKLDLIHAGPRILEFLPESTSNVIDKRLRELGVNILLNKKLMKEDVETIYFPDVKMKTKTLIWTAGVKPNELYESVTQFSFDKKGKVKVDGTLKALENVYVIGDGASTPDSGMARPAIDQGIYIAQVIANYISGGTPVSYQDEKPKFIIPIGPGWAASNAFGTTIYGRLGWFIKRARDLKFFLSILSLGDALTAFESDRKLTENCPICSQA